EDSEENLGTVIGTLVHRLFELGPEALRTSKENRQALLKAMAANILASSQLRDDPDGEEESTAVASPILASIVSSVERLVDRLSGRAALLDGTVQAHLALLHHGRVEALRFSLEELETFAADLEKELEEMNRFGE